MSLNNTTDARKTLFIIRTDFYYDDLSCKYFYNVRKMRLTAWKLRVRRAASAAVVALMSAARYANCLRLATRLRLLRAATEALKDTEIDCMPMLLNCKHVTTVILFVANRKSLRIGIPE